MPFRPKSKLARFAIAIIVVLAIVCIAGPRIVAPIVRSKLEALISDHLHASLRVSDFSYTPPYTLRVRDARLVAQSPNSDEISILDVGLLELTLAQFPLRSGPLLIERISLHDPKARIVRLPDRKVVGKDLIKHASPESAPRRWKLSDVLRIRSLAIERGEVIYEDQSHPDTAMMRWQNLNANLAIVPQSPAEYQFDFKADDGADAKLSAGGVVNVDAPSLQMSTFQLAAAYRPGAPTSAIPVSIQEILRAHDLRGAVEIAAKGELPAGNARAWRIDDLHGVVRLDDGAGSIEFDGSFERGLDNCTMDVVLHDVSHRPPAFDRPIQHANGTLRLEQNVVTIDHASARYGVDEWLLNTARFPLEDLARQISANDIDGQVTFNDPPTPYPAGLGRAIAALAPNGPFIVRGNYLFNRTLRGYRNQYDLLVSSQTGNLAPTALRIPIDRIRADAHVTRTGIEIPQLAADVFDGGLSLSATIDPRSPLSYQAQLTLEDADLSQAWDFFQIEGPSGAHITGRGSLTATLSADSPNLRSITSDGEAEIFDAQLWQGKILSHVVSEVRRAEGAPGGGADTQGAAVFHIEDGKVQLHRVAIYSPALGVQGSGTVDFDGSLDLDLAAAPLGDWEKHMQRLKIPLVGDVAAALVGGFQRMVDVATTQLLYEFRITGNIDDPQFEAIPAPILTDTGAAIFGRMLNREGSLIASLRPKDNQPAQRN